MPRMPNLFQPHTCQECRRTFITVNDEYCPDCKLKRGEFESPQIPREDPGYVTPRIRFLLFQRDSYRCQVCGRSPQEDDVKLEAGHKLARARGGSNTLDNLLTLCFGCNRGQRTDLL